MAEYTKWEVRTYTSSVFGNQAALTCKEVWMGERRIASTINEDNADLICALRNAAIKINPENPLAVAEGMDKVVKALKVSITLLELAEKSPHKVKWGEKYDCLTSLDRIVELKQALASIERGK